MQFVANVMLKRLAHSNRGSVLVEFALCLPVVLLMFLGGFCLSDMIACNRKVTTATRSLVDLVSRTMSPTIIYNAPTSADAKSYLSASAVVLAPYKLNNATEQISLLRVCDSSHAYVVWTQAQTQNADGSVVTTTQSSLTAGTLPTTSGSPAATATQSADTVVSIPSNMVTSVMVPVSPDGTNVCDNLAPGTSTKTQVGTAGGWLYVGQITYSYTPAVSVSQLPGTSFSLTTTALTETIYMVPRLY